MFRFPSPEFKTRWLLVLLSAWLLIPSEPVEAALADEAGTPLITNYSFRDYDEHPQNWAITQDHRGVMYFGNTNGVMEYDGTTWSSIPVANGSIARSLATDRNGRVYVGAIGEIGYLETDAAGELTYRSLRHRLPPEAQDFADVWRTFATDDGIFFWSYAGFFRWQAERFEIWPIETHWVPAVVRGKLYYNSARDGLQVFVDDDFQPVPGGEALADVRVNIILPAPDGALLLGNRNGELYTLRPPPVPATGDGAPANRAWQLRPFATAVGDYLATHKVYRALRLAAGDYLFATIDGGVLIMGPQGERRRVIDRTSGLPDNSVWAAFLDRQGSLWLGLNRGLSHIEIAAPLTLFGESAGIEGTVEAITRHQGKLYVATGAGLYGLEGRRFEPIPGVLPPCWSFLSYTLADGSDRLLVGGSQGVYELDDGAARLIQRTSNAFVLYRSQRNPSLLWVGTGQGLSVLRRQEGAWLDEGLVEGLADDTRSIAESPDGDLWLGTHVRGIVRLTVDPARPTVAGSLELFGTEHGLPALMGNKIHWLDEELLFSTQDGLKRFDAANRRFVPGPGLGVEAPAEPSILRLTPDAGGLWLSALGKQVPTRAERRPDGSYGLATGPLSRLPQALWYALFPEPDGVVWFGGTEGLFRYDSTIEANTDPDFATLLRSVQRADGTSIAGDAAAAESPGTASEVIPPSPLAPLPYSDNALTFQYSATTYCDEAANRFRYRLEGFDADWSPWSADRKKEYTNLPEGDYRFRVQARNIYGTPGTEAAYELSVLPPWYRTTAFRLALLAGVAGLGWLIASALLARARRIQHEITAQQQAVERERLIEQLEEKNAELERFAYTISHDLKAPLVTIRGFLGHLERDAAAGNTERLRRDIQRIDDASLKMHTLLEDLLEMSRIGRQQGTPQEIAMGELVGEALELLDGQLQASAVEVEVDRDLPTVIGDRARLLEVLQNLLQNAIKYMGSQTTPHIVIGTTNDDTHPAPHPGAAPTNGHPTTFFVRDNGMGIPPEYHQKIFGLFERLDAGTEGTGVGLALAQRIIEVHGGQIWVESEGQGRGSTFYFTLPEESPAGATT